MPIAYLGLGSNQGARREHLRAAVERLGRRSAICVEEASPVYETAAHTRSPEQQQPAFLNAVLRARVDCEPDALLRAAHAVEAEEGRTRSSGKQWAPRPLDIDLLAVGDRTYQTDVLTLPHPRLAQRRFVLRPWADLAPTFTVPSPFDQPVRVLLAQCPDTAAIRRTAVRIAVPGGSGPVRDASRS